MPVKRAKRCRSPASRRRSAASSNTTLTRKPLATSNKQNKEEDIWPKMVVIFNESQYVSKLDECLVSFMELYSSSDFSVFEDLFMKALKRLLQSKHTAYFKQACQFLCKLLKRVTEQNDDRLVRSCMEVIDHYMQVLHEDCRLNAVFLISKFLAQIDTLDEELCNVLKVTLSKRIRDKKASIRSHAVLAAGKFQDHKMIKDALEFHFRCDPELSVRKALLQTMDTKVFGCEFLVEATQDYHDTIRAATYRRLAKVSPSQMKQEQLHRVLHNGLSERDRTVAYVFRANMLAAWLAELFDGTDLVKLLEPLDVVNHTEDVRKLLEQLHGHNLSISVQLDDDETVSKLHQVVIHFKRQWLEKKRLPRVENLSERVILVWISLINFCKSNEVIIKTTKNPKFRNDIENEDDENDENQSLEKIIDSQESKDDDLTLYDLLMPDLVNLIKFVKQYVGYVHEKLVQGDKVDKYEFIYKNLMSLMASYEIGDESELKVAQEVLDKMLKENLLTLYFSRYVPPIVDCLNAWLFAGNSNLLLNYISEFINDTRSRLEDEQQDNIVDNDEVKVFRNHTGELLECLQMYYACLEHVKVTQVPPIMKNNLNHLCHEAFDDAFIKEKRIKRWMIACNGITAFLDKDFAQLGSTTTLLVASCYDNSSLEIKTIGFNSLVDVIIQHEDLEVPYDRLCRFLTTSLKDYGKYDPKHMEKEEMEFMTAIVRGTAKLYFFQKLSTPEALAHLVIWWYHPRTHSLIKQYIGVFLPLFVKHSSKNISPIDDWLEQLLSYLFVTCIEYLHSYILGPGSNIMDESDMDNMINFLINLVPSLFHPKVVEVIDEKIDEITSKEGSPDLLKYFRRSKKNLS